MGDAERKKNVKSLTFYSGLPLPSLASTIEGCCMHGHGMWARNESRCVRVSVVNTDSVAPRSLV